MKWSVLTATLAFFPVMAAIPAIANNCPESCTSSIDTRRQAAEESGACLRFADCPQYIEAHRDEQTRREPTGQQPRAEPSRPEPQTLPTGQVDSKPPKLPTDPIVRESRDRAIDDIRRNDLDAALKNVRDGLARDPNDEQLQTLDKLLSKRIQNPVDSQSLDRQIRSLVDPRSDTSGGAPSAGATGTLTAMRVRGPSAVLGRPVTEFKPPPREGPLLPAYQSIKVKDYSGAEKYLTQKIHENPLDWQAHRLRGLARFERGKYAGAVEDFEGALNINRNDIWVLNYLARAMAKLERIAEALEVLKESLELNNRNGFTYFTRSEVHRSAGHEAERLADLEQAAKYDEQFKNIYEDALEEYRRKKGLSGRLPLGRWPWALALLALAGTLALGYALRGRPAAVAAETPTQLAPAAPLALGPGARFGDFEIVRPIGQGGMGVVYEASDLLLGRAVAIKKLRDEIAVDPKERERFLKEAKIVASLDHPHIVRIHSVLDRPEGLFLVFEYIAGETLDRLLDRERKLSLHGMMHHLKTIANALDYAHRRGVIHRDLKPSNVMITREGVAKVMDFGIAWKAQETLARMTRKDGATIVGTPLYMAPEQSWGECVRESDVYALAMCCYEMLAGRPPFDGPNPQQLKMDKMFTPICRVVRRAPEALDRVFDRALDPIHSKRYHSAAELIAALEAVLPAESKT